MLLKGRPDTSTHPQQPTTTGKVTRMDSKTKAARSWPTHDASAMPPRCVLQVGQAQEPPHGKRTNVRRAHDDPGYPGEHKGDNPKHVPNEGTRHELLAAVLRRPSQQGGWRQRGRAVSMQE